MNEVLIAKSSQADLEGSTGLKVIHQKHPEVFIPSGIMERGNYSAAAGFGFAPDKFGVFSTFSAFLEMVISEITMARLNNCNVLSHFSHSGGQYFYVPSSRFQKAHTCQTFHS